VMPAIPPGRFLKRKVAEKCNRSLMQQTDESSSIS
jgi:hypothetical protein